MPEQTGSEQAMILLTRVARQRDALQQQLDEALEALRPFVETSANHYGKDPVATFDEDTPVMVEWPTTKKARPMTRLYIRDFRRARAILAKHQQKGKR